jgi:hypothetical protein
VRLESERAAVTRCQQSELLTGIVGAALGVEGCIGARPITLDDGFALMNLNEVTAKNASRAKLVGIGLGASTKRRAPGCAARNAPSASGLPAPAAAAARRNSRNSSPVRTGKPLVEWATMSVWI